MQLCAMYRSTRETTPCSLIRCSDTMGTPGSTTRPTHSSTTNQRIRNSMQRSIPTTNEMEEFFASAEQQQQRVFIEKYAHNICFHLLAIGNNLQHILTVYSLKLSNLYCFHMYIFRYNFDPVNEAPLPGRYEWERVDS